MALSFRIGWPPSVSACPIDLNAFDEHPLHDRGAARIDDYDIGTGTGF